MRSEPRPSDSTAVINRFFAAMQSGATSEAEMMALFADDAVYVEPFSGTVRTQAKKRSGTQCGRGGSGHYPKCGS